MEETGWSTQLLGQFVAAVSTADTARAAARATVEQAAEALDADVAALVCEGKLLASVGYPDGVAPVAEIDRVRPGAFSDLTVPGVGPCAATAAALRHPHGARLVVARAAPRGLTPEEIALLRGMAGIAGMTMRLLRVLEDERAARGELGKLAAEQAALRRVATLVARGEPRAAIFAAVAEEVGRVVTAADVAFVARYEADDSLEILGGWSRGGEASFVGSRIPLGGHNVSTLVFERNAPAHVDILPADGTPASSLARDWAQSAAGAPINVEGRLWGVMIVGSRHRGGLPPGIEHQLAAFTDLVATAIANAQAREELSALAAEQAALRSVATIVACGESSGAVFAAVAEEAGRVLPADITLVGRYDSDGTITGVGGWRTGAGALPAGTRVPAGGRNVTALVYETGQSARIDNYTEATGAAASNARTRGIRSAVGAPITVDGRIWGVMIVAATGDDPLPPDTEERLGGFTELVATAIANAQAREELSGLAAEQAALRRVATLVARAVGPDVVFAAVAEELTRLFATEGAAVVRFERDDEATVMGSHGLSLRMNPGGRITPDPRLPLAAVRRTGRATRFDVEPAEFAGLPEGVRTETFRSLIAGPIVVRDRLWGACVAASRSERLPVAAEHRMAEFAELVGTAIANAEAWAEIIASRARIAATADETRRRIERDLHDGAQQQLVSLALQLRAAQGAVPPDRQDLGLVLDQVIGGLTGTLDDLREYARGLHPAILAEGGLVAALKTLARRSSVPVELELPGAARLPEPIEVTAYYVVCEALANAAKHANASVVRVCVQFEDRRVRVAVRDDGVGGADPAHGSGLVGLKDRVAAVGGHLTVHSRLGEGTELLADLPVDASVPDPNR